MIYIYHPYLLLRPGVMVADDILHPVNSRKLDMMTDSEMLLRAATLCRSLAQVNMRTFAFSLEGFYTKA